MGKEEKQNGMKPFMAEVVVGKNYEDYGCVRSKRERF